MTQRGLDFFVREEFRHNVAGQTGRAQCGGINTAPAAFHLGQHLLAAFDDGFVKSARALHFFQNDGGDHLVIEKSWSAIGDFMFQRDPQMVGNRLGRGDGAPMAQHRILHPAEIMGVVHMAHKIDGFGADRKAVIVGQSGAFHNTDNNVSGALRKGESAALALKNVRFGLFADQPRPR